MFAFDAAVWAALYNEGNLIATVVVWGLPKKVSVWGLMFRIYLILQSLV